MVDTKEEKKLIGLLKNLGDKWSPDLFRTICNTVVTVPIELAVLNKKNEIFLIHRKDKEYVGYHIPGTVLRDSEDVSVSIKRLLGSEISGMSVTSPMCIGWAEITKGNGVGQNPTRHEIALIHVCWLLEPYLGKVGKFYPLHFLPKDVLLHHLVLIQRVNDWFKSKK